MNENKNAFFIGRQTPRETVGEGLVRQIFGYNDAIMMARVEFDTDAVGTVHSHPHTQVTYVESGEFDVYIDGEERRLGPGDSFFVGPDLDHGAVCRDAGVLIDVFSPAREDFFDEVQA
jgi:quercetin dioxygenase-like cupin family protein